MTKAKAWLNFHKSNLYVEVLEGMAASMSVDSKLKDKLAVPFVLTCASSLECLLNDNIIRHLWEIWSEDNYRPIVDGHLSMSLRGKLDTVVPLLTDNQYQLNRAHPAYQSLAELITQRNRIAHNKSFFDEVELELGEMDASGTATARLELPEQYLKQANDATFALSVGSKPLSYFQALKQLPFS